MTTITDIRKVMREITFNPKTQGPWSIIADVGTDEYYRLRAIELIRESPKNTKLAIQLLLLAEVAFNGTKRSKNTSKNRKYAKNKGLVCDENTRESI